MKPAKRKRERVLLRLELSEGRAGFFAADGFTASRLKARGFRPGDEVLAEITKARNSKFNRLVHQFGALLVANLDAFANLDSHSALKKIQVEANIQCDELHVCIGGFWPQVIEWVAANVGRPLAEVLKTAVDALGKDSTPVPVRIPRSLSFDSMSEDEFALFYRDLCRHVCANYWPTMTPQQVESMAGLVAEAA